MKVTLSAIQMTSTNNLQLNLQQLDTLLASAARSDSRLAVLPENFAIFGAESQLDSARQLPEILEWLQRACRRYDLWLVAGSLPCAERPSGEAITDGRVRAACFVLDADGQIQVRYDKIHLFDVEVADRQGSYRESAVFEPGDQVVTVETPWGKLGLAICYDLRFPALFQQLQQAGADFIAVPAAFTAVTGAAHWEVLLRCRAIETQTYVIGAAQTGRHTPLRETWGHSLVASPWGKVLACREEATPGVVHVPCDMSELIEIRQRMPLLAHRRLC